VWCRTTVVPIENNTVVLREDEERAVNQYISSDAYKINEKLRSDMPLTQSDQTLMHNLDSALDKFPKYEGELNRSLFFTSKAQIESYLSLFVLGEVIETKQYVSASKGVYDEADQVRLIIKNAKNGADLKGFNDKEEEVLYKRGSSFKTIDGWIEDTGKIVIVLEEYNG
ncbi:ADP-ribosyltransferase, partial [Sporolactobacillus shoreicorticis]